MEGVWAALAGIGYLGAAIFGVAALYHKEGARWAWALAWLGFVSQTLMLAAHMTGPARGQVASVGTVLGLATWAASASWLVGARRLGLEMLAAFLFPVAFLLWLMSLAFQGRGLVVLPPIWLWLGVALSALAVASLLQCAVFGIMYIEKERELAQKRVRLFYYQLPALDDLDAWMGRLCWWAWPALMLAVLVTRLARWHAPGWSDLGAVAIWAFLAGLAVGRTFWRWRGHGAAVGLMIAFLALLVDMGMVGTVLPGHSVWLW